MPVEKPVWQNIPLPLYQGLAENKDKQGILNEGAPVSQNVSFEKHGAISTRREWESFATGISGGNPRVWNSSEETRVVTDTNVYSVDSTRGATLLGSIDQGLEQDEFSFNQGYRGTESYTCVENGDDLVIAWSVPSPVTSTSTIYIAAIDKATGKFVWEPTSVDGVATPKLAATTGGIVLATENVVSGTAYLTFTPIDYSGGTYTVGTTTSTALSARIRQYSIAGSTADDYLWVIFNLRGSGTDWGPTNIGHFDRTGEVITLSAVSDGVASTLNTYSGDQFVCVGFHPVSEVPWFAVAQEKTLAQLYVFSSDVALTAGATSVVDGVGSTSTYGVRGNRPTFDGLLDMPGDQSGTNFWNFGQGDSFMDGFFVFPTGGTTETLLMWHGISSVGNDVSLNGTSFNTELIDSLGSQLALFSSDTPTTPDSTHLVPGCTLAAPGWLDSAGYLQVPVVWSTSWYGDYFTAAGGDRTTAYTTLGSRGGGRDVRSNYTTGLVLRVDPETGDAQAHTPFGTDEVYAKTNQDSAGLYSVFMPGDSSDNLVVTTRRTSNDVDPYVGLFGYGSRFGTDAFGFSGALTKFSSPPRSSNVSTPYRGVISSGGVRLFDGTDIVDAAMFCPPQPQGTLANTFSGSDGSGIVVRPREHGGDQYPNVFVFCWAWMDEQGLVWRSPPSEPLEIYTFDWDLAADEFRFWFQPPPPISLMTTSRMVLEVYRDQTDEDGVPTGAGLVLDTFLAVDPGQTTYSLEFKFTESQRGAPLLYTVGGVLPDEAPYPARQLVYAANRVWYIYDNRLYYSKQASYTKPLGFNGNLYLESPDGTRFTGVATMDEQVVVFTEGGIFLARGQGPNDTGGGGGFQLLSVQTPTGCRSYKSVLETELGVFFMGERGIHLLKRDLSVSYIGHAVEDEFGEQEVLFSLFDRDRKECMWTADGGTFVVFSLIAGAWSTLTSVSTAYDGTWTVREGLVIATASDVRSEDTGTTSCKPFKHSTPWIDLAQVAQGWQRAKNLHIQGHTNSAGYNELLTVDVYYDQELTARSTYTYDLSLFTSKDPLNIKVPLKWQKNSVFRVELSLGTEDLDLTITSILAECKLKSGAAKIPNS